MQAVQNACGLYAYPLGRQQSVRSVEQAVRCEAQVSLVLRTEAEPCVVGQVVAGTQESLWIALEAEPAPPIEVLPTVFCDGELKLGGALYLFSTSVLGVRDGESGRMLEIVRPDELEIVQRRRFLRASVRESSPVRLSLPAEAGAEPWSCRGSVLNLSVDGMACLTGQRDTDAVAVGERIHLEFELPQADETFAVEAVVRSKTPAGTEHRVVLGVQFQFQDAPAQFERLHAALQANF